MRADSVSEGEQCQWQCGFDTRRQGSGRQDVRTQAGRAMDEPAIVGPSAKSSRLLITAPSAAASVAVRLLQMQGLKALSLDASRFFSLWPGPRV